MSLLLLLLSLCSILLLLLLVSYIYIYIYMYIYILFYTYLTYFGPHNRVALLAAAAWEAVSGSDIYIYIYIYACILCIYIYIYMHVYCVYIYIYCVYIYIYIYILVRFARRRAPGSVDRIMEFVMSTERDIYIYIYIYIYILDTYNYTCIYTCVCMYIHYSRWNIIRQLPVRRAARPSSSPPSWLPRVVTGKLRGARTRRRPCMLRGWSAVESLSDMSWLPPNIEET